MLKRDNGFLIGSDKGVAGVRRFAVTAGGVYNGARAFLTGTGEAVLGRCVSCVRRSGMESRSFCVSNFRK